MYVLKLSYLHHGFDSRLRRATELLGKVHINRTNGRLNNITIICGQSEQLNPEALALIKDYYKGHTTPKVTVLYKAKEHKDMHLYHEISIVWELVTCIK